jgi:osmotically-inducible protein OsmY
VLSQALTFAQTAKARSIEIVGYRGAVRLSNGQTMVEEAAIDRRRAEQVAMLLRGANLTTPEYKVHWQDVSQEADGVDDHLIRRVVITVRP